MRVREGFLAKYLSHWKFREVSNFLVVIPRHFLRLYCCYGASAVVMQKHRLSLAITTFGQQRRGRSSFTLPGKEKDGNKDLLSKLKGILVGQPGNQKVVGDPLLTRLKRILRGKTHEEADELSAVKLASVHHDDGSQLPPHASMIEVLCKSGKFDEAYRGALAMLRQGLVIDALVLKTLVYGLYKCGSIVHSSKLAKEMIERPDVLAESYKQDVLLYTTLVEGLCKAGKADEAFLVFRASAAKMEYKSSTCEMLLRGLDELLGRGDEVFHLVVFMLEKGLAVRSDIFDSLIGKLFRGGHHELVLRACYRDNFSTLDHKTVLVELCNSGKADEASQFLVDLARRDSQVFAASVSLVCDTILQRGEYQLLERITQSSKGIRHSEATYNVLISALCKANRREEAQRVLLEMRDTGCEPDNGTYKLLKEFFKGERSDSAVELLRELIKEGKFEQALKLHDRLVSSTGRSVKLDIDSYNAILRQLWSSGRESEALKMFQQISRSGLVPDATTGDILITGLCRAKKAEAALKILQLMPGLGCIPNQHSYNTLLTAACDGDDCKLVELVLEGMHINGLRPDYNTALLCYSRLGKFSEMQSLFKRMIERGCEPSERTCKLVVGELCEAKQLNSAWEMIQVVVKAGFSLHQGTYRPFVVALLKAGDLDKARQHFGRMDSTVVLQCFLEAGLVTEACSHYRKMVEEEGCDEIGVMVGMICSCSEFGVVAACKLLKDDSVSKLIGELLKKRRLDAIVEVLVGWARTRGSDGKSFAVYDLVIMDMCKVGRFEEAAQVVEHLFAKGLLLPIKAMKNC